MLQMRKMSQADAQQLGSQMCKEVNGSWCFTVKEVMPGEFTCEINNENLKVCPEKEGGYVCLFKSANTTLHGETMNTPAEAVISTLTHMKETIALFNENFEVAADEGYASSRG